MKRPHSVHYYLRFFSVALGSGFLVGGCAVLPSHLHNDANATRAKGAYDKWNQYSKAAPDIYAALAANVNQFKTEEDKVLADLAESHRAALVAALPDLTELDLNDRASKGLAEVEEFLEKTVPAKARELTDAAAAAAAKKQDSDALVAKLKESVATAEKNVETWNAYIAVLQKGLADLPPELRQSDTVSLTSLADVASHIGSQKVSYADAEGKIVTESVSVIVKKIGSRFGDRFAGLITDRDGKQNIKGIFPKAPGINVTILNLGLDLADLERKEAEAALKQIHEETIVFEDAVSEMHIAEQLYQEVIAATQGRSDRRVIVTLADEWDKAANDLKKGAGANGPTLGENLSSLEGTTITNLVRLRKLATAETIRARQASLLPLRIARLKHLASISNSAVADESHQALIRRGIEGLSAYHAGGFTKEDAARIIQLAQSVALGVIAHNTR